MVHLGRDGAHVFVSVVDDGAGGADPTRGSGLLGLADRVAALEGALHIESAPRGGTSIRVTLPLQAVSGSASEADPERLRH